MGTPYFPDYLVSHQVMDRISSLFHGLLYKQCPLHVGISIDGKISLYLLVSMNFHSEDNNRFSIQGNGKGFRQIIFSNIKETSCRCVSLSG